MKFGEKLRQLRKSKGMSQTELGNQLGVTLRTVRGWELEGRYPKKRELYAKIAEILECEVSYLLTEEEDFITGASELYGSRGAKQAEQILEQTAAMFAGGELSDTEQIAFINEIQSLYLDSKKRAKKFTPKKYRVTEE
ncbi:MAG: helix-turn-helix domain-containing protein [Clostridiales bacterium]|nr:helix-turn-helix domain-containing protein [Clostridiales bacterium]